MCYCTLFIAPWFFFSRPPSCETCRLSSDRSCWWQLSTPELWNATASRGCIWRVSQHFLFQKAKQHASHSDSGILISIADAVQRFATPGSSGSADTVIFNLCVFYLKSSDFRLFWCTHPKTLQNSQKSTFCLAPPLFWLPSFRYFWMCTSCSPPSLLL
jgi:hypothetical protein